MSADQVVTFVQLRDVCAVDESKKVIIQASSRHEKQRIQKGKRKERKRSDRALGREGEASPGTHKMKGRSHLEKGNETKI